MLLSIEHSLGENSKAVENCNAYVMYVFKVNTLFYKLEGLAPYGGQTTSPCGGLVAFGHQMGALRAPIW